ncbi:hypothetical protein HK100_004009 [Physocladia obscura]|uniref:Uncharacterized protein n=1 Tax=Physocladia obscura TaxID=109957 RepID=A0AAD5XGU2_9FUNG|nr:hypothetical protein HK100_004009 [Physocladia obscura]
MLPSRLKALLVLEAEAELADDEADVAEEEDDDDDAATSASTAALMIGSMTVAAEAPVESLEQSAIRVVNSEVEFLPTSDGALPMHVAQAGPPLAYCVQKHDAIESATAETSCAYSVSILKVF